MVSGSPDGFGLFERFISDFEQAGSVRYERREQPNKLTMIFFYPANTEMQLEQIRLITSRIGELFITVTSDKKTTLFHEGKVKVYPIGA